MRFDIVKYLVDYGALPDGRDPVIRNEIWGISYAFYPILPYMIMSVPAKIVSLMTGDPFAVLIAARVVNAVIGTITAYFTLRIAEMLFSDWSKYLFVALVVFLPGFIFVNSYVNNDACAVMSTAWMSLVWVRSMKEGWNRNLCIQLAVAISICTLSYYNAYGFILCSILFFFITISAEKTAVNRKKYILSRTLLIVLIVLALILWWFIRNQMLYGDFMGRNISEKYAEMYAMDGFKPSQRTSFLDGGGGVIDLLAYGGPGVFAGNWLLTVAVSFVGTFGAMNVIMPYWLSYIYLAGMAVGVAGVFTCLPSVFRIRKDKKLCHMGVFSWCMLIVIVITFGLLVYYNLFSDLQAQGRYMMPALIPIMYFVTAGIRRWFSLIIKDDKKRGIAYSIITVLLILACVYTYLRVFLPVYVLLP